MRPIITITTDFGLEDHYVAAMKGVILRIAPESTLVDITHLVPPGDIRSGAYSLDAVWQDFPAGTVHLAVVDPGVGGARAPLAVSTDQGFFVGPDNGILSPALVGTTGRKIVRLMNQSRQNCPVSPTFHGRDIFAPAAAWLAIGTPIEELGDVVDSMVELEMQLPVVVSGGIHGSVIHVDRFGNLITNISAQMIKEAPGQIEVSMAGQSIGSLRRNYSDTEPGQPLAYIGSSNRLEISVRDGSAEKHFAAGLDTPVMTVFKNS